MRNILYKRVPGYLVIIIVTAMLIATGVILFSIPQSPTPIPSESIYGESSEQKEGEHEDNMIIMPSGRGFIIF